MSMAEPNKETFTYGDYIKWPEEERWELIEGQPYAMTLAPTVRHQEVAAALIQQLRNYFEGKPCKAFCAPLDVRFPRADESDERVETVVQPDLLVVCDPAKIDEKGIRGAPDLVIEILSNTTADRDLGEKLLLYEKHGVRCYLIVDPWSKTCIRRLLAGDGKYGRPELFIAGDAMPTGIFPELSLDLARVFA